MKGNDPKLIKVEVDGLGEYDTPSFVDFSSRCSSLTLDDVDASEDVADTKAIEWQRGEEILLHRFKPLERENENALSKRGVV